MTGPPRDQALRELELLLEIGHVHLAFLHASEHGTSWDEERRLEALELLQRHDATAQAITLCHRWLLSKSCRRKNRTLYRELFPELPPRTDKGDKK